MLLQIKSSFLNVKLLFNHITPLLKVQETCTDSLKTLGITNKMGTEIELVNTRNNTTAIQKDVKNFKGGKLRYFSKNWHKQIG